MYPHERSLVEKYADKPFAIVGVNSDPDIVKLREIVAEKKLAWPSFFDGGFIGGPIATRWGVRGWPTVYVIDSKGAIRFKNTRGPALDNAIEALLAEVD
ncbi:MAG TPA: TlpA disulfide reductase family protein [Planctomycetota bacterium]|nr:TlpA disulfide reductase family protein [Planctomycetota bacterium]